MNTVAIDDNRRFIEDFAAIPDLAAGMASEVMANSTREATESGLKFVAARGLTPKTTLIADWFAHNSGTLRKSCILIDQLEKGIFGVGQLHLSDANEGGLEFRGPVPT